MSAARLLTAVLLFLVLAPSAQARRDALTAKLGAPQSVSAFLLRPGDSPTRTFSRTPSFSWKPVRGATRYELMLSTSSLSAGNGIVWDDAKLTTPAADVPIALPWITGNPYSLYARVRAIDASGKVGAWSTPFGFTMRWPNIPQQLSAAPGLVRWSTVDGATAYQVWFMNLNIQNKLHSKIIQTVTNVADEREYYTLHQSPKYTALVQWRVRAVRQVYGSPNNALPATTYGPWSEPYTSTNPTFADGPLSGLQAISDKTSTESQPTAHHLMPAFTWSGNEGLEGFPEELYRIYVFTDHDCVNYVFKGAIVGSPAYAPRSTGALALPTDASALATDRTTFLADGKQPTSFFFDGGDATPTEDLPPATFTPQTLTGSTGTATTTGTPTGDTGTTGTTGSTLDPSTGSGNSSSPFVFPTSLTGASAPVDLWDTDWPSARYYWTVVPVQEQMPDLKTTWLATTAAAGTKTFFLADASAFAAGGTIQLGVGANREAATIASITNGLVTLKDPLTLSHLAGDEVDLMTGSVEYYDDEVAQDACAAGRVASFGRTSEPSLTSPNASIPFAAGLSPAGRFVAAATPRPTFYGSPLVAWAPAAGATAYEVQWSKQKYPWHTAADPIYTFSTSATLPLKPGTWYYHVRGIDLALPTGAQQMAWSDPTAIVVAKPHFVVQNG
jgi:hypothetical protein